MNQELIAKLIEQLKIIANGVNNIWPIVASFLVGFIALLVGILGIFQDRVRELFRKPELLVSLKLESPDCCNIPMDIYRNNQLYSRIKCYYFRFKVENIGNFQMADVEAMVTDIYKKENNTYKKVKSFLPQNLLWANIHTITMQKIQPELYKHLDFGHIIKSVDSKLLFNFSASIFQNSKIVFIFDVAVAPNNLNHILEPGDYKLRIVFAANNMKSSEKFYHLFFKDYWSDNENIMFSNNILIEEIKNF